MIVTISVALMSAPLRPQAEIQRQLFRSYRENCAGTGCPILATPWGPNGSLKMPAAAPKGPGFAAVVYGGDGGSSLKLCGVRPIRWHRQPQESAMRWIVVMATVLTLAACVGTRMNEHLKPLLGQNISAAVGRLGYPDGTRDMLGDTIYVWSTEHTGMMVLPTASTTYGAIGGMPYSSTTTGLGLMPAHFFCRVQLGTDAAGTIKNYQWNGNPGGCARYANALGR